MGGRGTVLAGAQLLTRVAEKTPSETHLSLRGSRALVHLIQAAPR